MDNRIWLSLAHMGGHEQKFVQEAFDTNWVVPLGPNVDGFEKDLSDYINDNKHVVCLSSGTAAIHLGLILLGVKANDEVLCQSFTFAASANPIAYLGASPIFIDSEKETWNMDPELMEEAIKDRINKTGKKPKAIISVHLYGMPAKMEEIMTIAQKYEIPVLEDAAEALGSKYKERNCSTFGHLSALSFNGNKMITTSGGGALICNTIQEAELAKFYATQARDAAPHYEHTQIGYNYRMSNICAGIGRGQMFVLEEHIKRRKEIHKLYCQLLKEIDGIQVMDNFSSDFDSNFWLTCILINSDIFGFSYNDIRVHLNNRNIETRPLWKPMHLQPVYAQAAYYENGVSSSLFKNGLCLPSGSSLSDDDIVRVVEGIKSLT